jgi:hypothetical protein
MGEERD